MKKIAPLSVPFIPARWHGGAQTPKAIVIHGTVSPCRRGGARDTARFFARETGKTSAHYVVDPAETIQCVGDHVIAFHCGFNTGSIAFELCDPQAGPGSRWHDADHTAMLDLAAHDVARTALAYGIELEHVTVADLKAKGPHGIYDHNASRLAFGNTTHSDVGPDFPWPSFMSAVHKYAAELSAGREEPAVTTPAQQFRAKLLAACQWAAAAVPAKRTGVHVIRRAVAALAKRIK